MQNKLTQQQLDQLTAEMQDFMETSGFKRFPPAKVDELATYGVKRCSRCTQVKHTDDFPKNSRTRDGLQSQCRACDCAGTTDYQKRNPDRVQEYNREYQRTRYATDELHRMRKQLDSGYYRAVQVGNDADWITPEELLTYWDAKDIDPLRCYLTGAELTPFDRSLDHVVSIANGGGHTVDNLLPCTWEANDKKRTLSPDEAKQKLTND